MTKSPNFLSSNSHESTESFDAGKHGKDYEIEMSKFVFKRLLDNDYDNFSFTREKKGLGKFDDLVIIYESSNSRKKYCLIQLKHFFDNSKKIDYESLAENPKSYFYLPKYFSYYIESLNNIKKDPDFEDAELDQLIICSNALFDENLRHIEKHLYTNNDIFQKSGDLYKLKISEEDRRAIFTNNYISDRQKLADELSFSIWLNKPIDINSLVKCQHVSLFKIYHVALEEHVIDVENRSFKKEFVDLAERNTDLYSFKETLLFCIEKFWICYKTLNTEELKKRLQIQEKKVEELSELLIKYQNIDSLTFLRHVKLHIKSGFGDISLYNGYVNYLPSGIVNTDLIDNNIDVFLNVLAFAVGQENKVLVIREELKENIFIAYNDKMNQWYHHGSYKDRGNEDSRIREWLTKDKLVSQAMSTSLKFQGKRIKMNQLIDKKNLDSEVLMKTFCEIEINIEDDVQHYVEANKYYISRILTRQRALRIDVLREIDISLFIIRRTEGMLFQIEELDVLPEDISYDININKTIRYNFVDAVFCDKDFDKFVSYHEFDSANIIWVDIDGADLLWRRSIVPFSILQKYFYERDFDESVIELELVKDSQPSIIVGEPGMGKTRLFHHISEVIYNSSLNDIKVKWVLKFLLREFFHVFSESENITNVDELVEMIAKLKNESTSFYKKSLKENFLYGNVVLMFDGFDELSSVSQQKRLLIILTFVNNYLPGNRILITTRPHCKVMLENVLGVVAFSIKEINEEEQVLFVSEYWKNNSNLSEEHITMYATKLVKSFNMHIKEHEKSFLGIPLQSYMFAVVFLRDVVQDNPLIDYTNLPITHLFKQFFLAKYDIYFQKYLRTELPEEIKQVLIESFDDYHQNIALSYQKILEQEDCEHFLIHLSSALTVEKLLDIGILYKLNVTFDFIHKTFAEYLVAKRLSNVIFKSENILENQKNVLLKLVADLDKKFLLRLFDTEVTENLPLHRAVLDGNKNKLNNMDTSDFNSRDKLGRSLAYYAVQYRHIGIIDMLINKEIFEAKNDLFLIVALKVFIKDHYNAAEENGNQIIINIIGNLLDLSRDFYQQFISAFDVILEIKYKRWIIVEKLLLKKTQASKSNLHYLNLALKIEAPLSIINMILDNIKVCGDYIDQEIVAYSNFIKYLFVCPPQNIESLIFKYTTSFKLGTLKRVPLFVGMYEYFDLRSVTFGSTFTSLLKSVRERASTYCLIVKLLFEYGASYLILKENEYDDVFEDAKYNPRLLQKPIHLFFEDKFEPQFCLFSNKLETLKRIVKERNHDNITTENLQILKDIWTGLEVYMNEFPMDLNECIMNVITNTIQSLLKSSQAGKLIALAYGFQTAVQDNKNKRVKLYLKKAKKYGWVKALLNVTDSNMNVAEDIAKENLSFHIFTLLKFLKRQIR